MVSIQQQPSQVVTRSGWVSKPPARYQPPFKGQQYADVHDTVWNGETFEYYKKISDFFFFDKSMIIQLFGFEYLPIGLNYLTHK